MADPFIPVHTLTLPRFAPACHRITPFGMPEYDGGERFDLRLPYVDNGWVDEDADPVKQFRRFIGLDKKKSEDADGGPSQKGSKK